MSRSAIRSTTIVPALGERLLFALYTDEYTPAATARNSISRMHGSIELQPSAREQALAASDVGSAVLRVQQIGM
jgi:hypothetical protein